MATVKQKKETSYGSFSIAEDVNQEVGQIEILEESIADGVTDQEHLFAIDVSALKAFAMTCDVALTVETNDGTTPQETFALAAGEQLHWRTGDTAIFSGDVTKLLLTNASGSAGTFKCIRAQDVV